MLELTGSYSLLWGATFVVGIVAAVLHFPIDDRRAGTAVVQAS